MTPFEIRGFNLCESLLRHSPDQLRRFIRRMKRLDMNTIIIHYDYGWNRYRELILEECEKNGIEIILMTFGPRTFLAYSDWKPSWFAKNADGVPFFNRLECETHPCRFEEECLVAYEAGARQWLRSLPPQIRHVHVRAADGIFFCQCSRCRALPEHERWQPFVERFVKAVQEERPDLKFEMDVYVMRYNIPGNRKPFEAMTGIMYDTFYRSSFFPLGVDDDLASAPMLPYAAGHTQPDSATVSRYHANRLAEWCRSFPGKIYIHENAMGQGLFGTFQYAGGSYLKDLELYRRLGVRGVCYEAYEPGYANFAAMFEELAAALAGREVHHEPSELETLLPTWNMQFFCMDPELRLEKFIPDPFLLEQNRLFRDYLLKPGVEHTRRYIEFAYEHEERMDPLFIGFGCLQSLRRNHIADFPGVSYLARDLLSRRKLWDFMEEIPLSQDPRQVCKEIIFELLNSCTPSK